MALDEDRLGDAIRVAVNAVTEAETGETPTDSDLRTKMFHAIGAAIVEEFITNAEVPVSTNVTVTSVSGVTTGPGVSGPGTGAGSGTGSIV